MLYDGVRYVEGIGDIVDKDTIDIDEELSQMIIFQQSYAACAQVFTASREILDILLGLV